MEAPSSRSTSRRATQPDASRTKKRRSHTKAPRPRRTNEQRTREMRARLLDATVECLFDLGYARTTTTVVCERAGVSRGAQLHHFPTKAALVTTAVEHLFERRRTELLASAAELPTEEGRPQQVIELLWQIVSGPTFYAWLELVVAARTDAELRDSLQALSSRMTESTLEAFGQIFPATSPGDFREIVAFVFSVLEGLALRQISDRDDADVEGVLNVLKSLTELVDLSNPSSALSLPDAVSTSIRP